MKQTFLFILAVVSSAPAYAAPPPISVVVDPAAAATQHEVVPLSEVALSNALLGGAMRAGFAVNGPDAIPVTVRVTSYHSGARFGGSKTATVTADVVVPGQAPSTIDCRFTSRIDLRSSEKRNITAVDGCFAELGQAFGARMHAVLVATSR